VEIKESGDNEGPIDIQLCCGEAEALEEVREAIPPTKPQAAVRELFRRIWSRFDGFPQGCNFLHLDKFPPRDETPS